jgi:fructose-1-phosphate kinase PfkB-like protein
MGEVLNTPMECAMAAQKLYLTGIPKVIITLGDRGAVAFNANGAWLAVPPKLHGAAIGSGDALLAGVVYALVQQRSLDDALRWGVAAGAANVLIPGAGVFNVMDAVRISQQVKVMELRVQA